MAFTELMEESAKLHEEKERERAVQSQSGNNEKTEKEPAAGKNAVRIEESFGKGFQVPGYDVSYKQTVDASEVYGGFSGMAPSIADSQQYIVTVDLAGENPRDVDLDVTSSTLTLYGKVYRLHLELPHTVLEDKTRASYQGSKLRVVLTRNDILG